MLMFWEQGRHSLYSDEGFKYDKPAFTGTQDYLAFGRILLYKRKIPKAMVRGFRTNLTSEDFDLPLL